MCNLPAVVQNASGIDMSSLFSPDKLVASSNDDYDDVGCRIQGQSCRARFVTYGIRMRMCEQAVLPLRVCRFLLIAGVCCVPRWWIADSCIATAWS